MLWCSPKRKSNPCCSILSVLTLICRQSVLPEEYKDEMRAAAKKVNLDFDKDFKLTDNTCKPHPVDKAQVKRVCPFLTDFGLSSRVPAKCIL